MTEACCIDHKGVRHVFTNKNEEEPSMFVKRCWVWVKNLEAFPDVATLDMLSHAYVNVLYKGVRYDKKTMSMIEQLCH